jgi:hypothetical protein
MAPFKDIENLADYEGQLINVVLSSNPCPDCDAINGQSDTYEGWQNSEYGLPGSDSRLCCQHCHCILVPEDALADLPEIGDSIKLRGDLDSDIRKIVDIGPNEESLKSLMEEWYQLGNQKLPPEIYDMEFDEIEAYMKKRLAQYRNAVGDVQV